MWYRLIGGGLLLLCAGVWARDRTSAQRADVMRISALCDLLVHVGEQVATYCMPLDEIAATLPTDLAQACDLCAEGLIPTLAAASERIADGEAAAALARAAAQLGHGEQEDQVALCRATSATLGTCRDRLLARLARDRRARGTLCLTGCLLVIILLW